MTPPKRPAVASPQGGAASGPAEPAPRRLLDDPVPSPCISVCRMNPQSGLCDGCLRTLDEIAAWSRMDDAGKRVVWTLIEQRRAALPEAAR